MLTVLLEYIFRHMKEEKVTENSQDEFTKDKTCLINLTAVSEKINRFVHMQKCFPLLSALSAVKRTCLGIIGILQF